MGGALRAAVTEAQSVPGHLSARPAVDLEVVIPAHNEKARLARTLPEVVAYLERQPLSAAVVVVDNGSTDGTATVASAIAHSARVPVHVLRCPRRGKGLAVRLGVLTGSSRYVGFMDADLATPLESLEVALLWLRSGVPVVIGSRRVEGARYAIGQGWRRRLGGWAFRRLCGFLVPGIRDTQCGFKFFQGPLARSLFSHCRVLGFAFDVELLLLARLRGQEVVELPVVWSDRGGSSFRPWRDGLRSLLELADIARRLALLPGRRRGESQLRTPVGGSARWAVAATCLLWLVLVTTALFEAGWLVGSSDWSQFMVGGRLLASDPAHLYDSSLQLQLQHALIHGDFLQAGPAGLLPAVNPPWVYFLSAAFAGLGVEAGGRLWILVELAALAVAAGLVGGRRALWPALTALGGIPALLLVRNAQLDGLVVLGLALAWKWLSPGPGRVARRELAAGAALGLTLLKPHLTLGVAVGLIAARRWWVLLGWGAAACLLAGAATVVEPHLLPAWLAFAFGSAGRLGDDLSLPGLALALGGGVPAAAVAAAAALAATVLLARGRPPGQAAGLLILGGLLAAPHALPTDLLLAAFALLIGDRADLRRLLALSMAALSLALLTPVRVAVGVPALHVLAAAAGSALLLLAMVDLARPEGLPAALAAAHARLRGHGVGPLTCPSGKGDLFAAGPRQ